MAKKGIEDILNANLSKEEIQKILAKTKWLSWLNPEEITLEVLEKLYRKVVKKYNAQISYILTAGDDKWSFSIRENGSDRWIYSVYSKSLYIGFAKSILVLYGYFIKGIPFKAGGKQ